MSNLEPQKLKNIVESALFAAGEPLSIERLLGLFEEDERPEKKTLQAIISTLQQECDGRGIELREVSSGFRYQARTDVSCWVSRLWEERAPRYSRALLETLALVAYRQPITRAEIEDVRGVAVSSSIMKTLQERGWVRIVGHRDVPGRPAMYATTREFLDYFNLKSLDQMPTLAELRDIDKINAELDLRLPGESGAEPTSPDDPQAVAAAVTADFEPVEY
ncbi:MAG: SMC-Scp complex subunit ScpB [Gammaproteobacteria bacterium]|nr:SMC-Scp complex subunit ScpB [Gammaproteobacteria bacterium]MCW8839805.1 SMC-Scp complex subunit ScpB [Gammaproteobacteria bacterium]MCW8957725.1 SMC-Scp complex subunit ScpB [Gammaproteobacteria bacterium]MCW8973935.1 SMC-Scp complex subunit ScpB [Gammaproteobacteria bacterium]MCW8993051.1 SMC-Scp complex subunit ScpB [Gammaproteobacteria bacterium]